MLQFQEICSVTLVLFTVIDILGALPIVIELRNRAGDLKSLTTTIISGGLMISFLFVGEQILHLFGTDIQSFAVAGAMIIFAIGVEMILGVRLFRDDPHGNNSTISYVPLAFPIIAGCGTLTTILSLKADYGQSNILVGIVVNLVAIYLVLRFCGWFERRLGDSGMAILRKVFGIVLLSIAVKMLRSNLFD